MKCELCEPGVGYGYLVNNDIVRGVLQHLSETPARHIEQRNDLAVVVGRSSETSDGVSSRYCVSLVDCSSPRIYFRGVDFLACC